jgi:hypothetical protein
MEAPKSRGTSASRGDLVVGDLDSVSAATLAGIAGSAMGRSAYLLAPVIGGGHRFDSFRGRFSVSRFRQRVHRIIRRTSGSSSTYRIRVSPQHDVLIATRRYATEKLPLSLRAQIGPSRRSGREPGRKLAAVSVTLELRHLWTTTGGPITWKLDGADERHLRRAVRRLFEHEADPETRRAVLILRGDDGEIAGAWSREGAAALAEIVLIDAPSGEWLDIRNRLLDGASGP